MKKLLLICTFLLSVFSLAQIKFEPGYYIDNSGNKTECLIKNIEWKSNPTSFNYKSSENDDVKTATIKNVQLFEIYNQSKYVRKTVNVDQSSKNPTDFSLVKEPEFKEEEAFLKKVVEGPASLYSYKNQGLERYFLQMGDQDLEPLIYKPYRYESVNYRYNEKYKQLLTKNLNCSSVSKDKINRTLYRQNDLMKIVQSYNNCVNPNEVQQTTAKNNGIFTLAIRPRVNSSSFEVSNSEVFRDKTSFKSDNEIGFALGLEAEYIFPFNKNKWSFIVEPTYQYFKTEKTQDASYVTGGKLTTKVDYKSIELPFGVRHYMFLNDQSKLFVNVQYILDFPMDSKIEFTRADGSSYNILEVKAKPNIGIGLGYKYDNKFSIEARYLTNRSLTNTYVLWDSSYKTFSLILGYNFF